MTKRYRRKITMKTINIRKMLDEFDIGKKARDKYCLHINDLVIYKSKEGEIRFGVIKKIFMSTFGSKVKDIAITLHQNNKNRFGRNNYTIRINRCKQFIPYCSICGYVRYNNCINKNHNWKDIADDNKIIPKDIQNKFITNNGCIDNDST